MSNDAMLQQQLDALKAELDTSKQREEALEAKLRELDEKAITEKIEALSSELQTKDEEIAEMLEAQKSALAEKSELTEALEKVNEEFGAIQAELETIKAEAHKAKRLAALIAAGLDEEAAAEKLEKFAGADDELFDEIVALISVPSEETVEEEVEAEADADVEAEEVAEADEDIASDEAADEADAETLEEAEEEVEASLTDAGETEEVEEARTSASDWLRKNILKSTASIEK